MPTDRYQVIGRNVHMDFVQEHLRTQKNVNFEDTQERPNSIELEVLADTVYVRVCCLNYSNSNYLYVTNYSILLYKLCV